MLDRGKELAKIGAVDSWNWEPGIAVTASVEGGNDYDLKIPFENGRFRASHCECAYESNCKHAAAAMLTALKASGASGRKKAKPAPVPPVSAPAPRPEPLVALAQARVPEALAMAAKVALQQVDAWWSARKRSLPLVDLLGIGGQRNIWSREAVEIFSKDSPPQDVWEYLACVDSILTHRGGALPAPLPDLIDRVRQKELMESLLVAEREREWRGRLRNWATALPDLDQSSRPALRLRLNPAGAAIEWRRPGQSEFARVTVGVMKGLPFVDERSAEGMILTFSNNAWGSLKTEFRATEDDFSNVMLQLLSFPSMRHALVGQTGAPLVFHEKPLTWEIVEAPPVGYSLQLKDAEGRVPPDPLLVVVSSPSWFITPDEVWPLAHWPFPATDGLARMEMPLSVLETGDGVTVLRKMGLPLPPRLKEKVRSVPALVTVRAKVHNPGEGRSAYLWAEASADYGGEAPSERLAHEGWQSLKKAQSSAKDGAFLTFDRSALTATVAWLTAMELKHAAGAWNVVEDWWERRITKEFPEQFLQWMVGRPQGIMVELDAELSSLRDGLVSGTVRLEMEESGMDWFDLRVALDVADTTLSPEEIQLLLKAQGRWVRIEGKGWRKLQLAMTPEQEAELAAMGLAVADFDGSPQRLHAL